MGKKLFDYQLAGAKWLRKIGRGILADEMGLGKTAQAIAAAAVPGGNPRILVLCPSSIMVNWANEIQDTLSVKQTIEVYDKKQVRCDSRWTIINYEAAKLERNLDSILETKWDVIIIDEAHRLKNRKSDISKCVKKMRSRHMYMLTGTPFKDNPSDIWSLLNVLYPKRYSGYWKWAEKYVVYDDGYFGKTVVGYKNLNKLKAELNGIMLRRPRSAVVNELPEKLYHNIVVDMEPDQTRMYNQMLDEFMAELNSCEVVSAPAVISRLTRLRQIATAPALLTEDKRTKVHSTKLDALATLLANAAMQGRKCVIFSSWSRMVDVIGDLLDSMNIRHVKYTGKLSPAKRDKYVNDFQSNPYVRCFVGTIGAGGVGITLTAADIVIFTDRAWTPDDNLQAEDRCYARANDMHGVDIYNIIAGGTVDEGIDELLREKLATIGMIID